MDQDFLLVRRMKNGDEDAMDKFVRKFYPQVLKYCRYHIADAGYAEDVAQETFVRFFGALAGYQHLGKAANYLYVIAGNLCRDWYGRHTDIVMETVPVPADHAAEEADVRLELWMALTLLPEDLREVIILHYFQDLKLKEIARVCGIGLPLVKYRLKKAKEKLYELLTC